MGSIIAFSGTDGAGKSTQIQLLEKYLLEQGKRPTQFWARGGYTPLFQWLKRLYRKLRPGALPSAGASEARSQQFQSSRVRRVWLLVSILDLILCYGLWLRVKQLCGYTVICDRYIEDTLLDFRHNFPQENVGAWFFWKMLKVLSPKPRARFLLIVPPQESARRSKLKNEPFPDSPETLQWRYECYQELASSGRWKAIDCQTSIDAVQAQIIETLKPCD